MARAKQVPQAKPADWKPHEENELLAWLDYNLLKSEGFKSFKESVSGHLTRECNVNYTYEQCRSKLHRFWMSYGDENDTKVAVLHERGSKCLTHLPDERKDFIFGRATELSDRDFDSPRRLRSTSHISETPPWHQVDLGQWATSKNQRRAYRQHGSRLQLPSGVIPSINTPEVAHHEEERSKKRCLPGQQYGTLPNDCIPKTEPKDSTSDGASRRSPLTVGEGETTSDEEDECNSGAGSEMSDADDVTMVPVPSTRNINDKVMTSNPLLTSELDSLKIELEALKKQVQLMSKLQKESHSHMAFLHSRLRQAEDRHRDYEARISHLKSAEAARADNISLYQQLEDQETMIAILQKKLNKARDLGKFTRLSSANEIRPWRDENIRETMSSIGYLTKQLLFGHDNIDNFDPPNIDNNEHLAMLVRKSLGMTSRMQVAADTIPVRLSDLSLQAIVRALTAAALCEWVFEADLHGTILTESMLLDEYRAHIRTRGGYSSIGPPFLFLSLLAPFCSSPPSCLTCHSGSVLCGTILLIRPKDGETSLRNLDFAAHQSLFDGTLFQEHAIPKRAEELAYQLSRTLSPFFVEEEGKEKDQAGPCRDSSFDSFGTWGVEENIWTARRDKLIKIFEYALKIKYQFVTSSYRFEAALHPPQTPFEPDHMTPETMEGSVMRTAAFSGQNLEVKLCLLPSLYVLKHDCTQVTYNNFVQRDSAERQESERLTEAVVVIGLP